MELLFTIHHMNFKNLHIDSFRLLNQKTSFITSGSKFGINSVWNPEPRLESEKAYKAMEISSDCFRLANTFNSKNTFTSKTGLNIYFNAS